MKKINTNFNYQINIGEQLFAQVANKLVLLSNTNVGKAKHISLFGGSTVFKLFSYLEENNLVKDINWNDLHLWWNDERLVPVESNESNYGELYRKHLSNYNIPAENFHPINCPSENSYEAIEQEVRRMTQEVKNLIPANKHGVPSFDLILLGIGEDGHTASLFPGMFTTSDPSLYIPSFHPISLQNRISQSIKLLNNAQELVFIATGAGKANTMLEIIGMIYGRMIINSMPKLSQRPVSEQEVKDLSFHFLEKAVSPVVHLGLGHCKTTIYLDEAAGNLSFEHYEKNFKMLLATLSAKEAEQANQAEVAKSEE